MKLITLTITSLAMLGVAAFEAAAQDQVTQALTCRDINDRVARLACFDQAFDTPIIRPLQTSYDKVQTPPLGPVRILAENLERTRAPGNAGWIVASRPWHEDTLVPQTVFEHVAMQAASLDPNMAPTATSQWAVESADVFMTLRETTGVSPDRAANDPALLLISCESNITTLALLLPKPVPELQTSLTFSGEDQIPVQRVWRDVENREVLIAGRGLESIDTIKALSSHRRVQVQVSYPDGPRAFVFDIGDVQAQLPPVRAACHW